MLKKPPRVRDNNGALQARGQAICAEIWRDAKQGDLDLSLNRYRPLVEGRDQELIDALRGTFIGEETGKGDSCLSDGEAVWLANQDTS